MTAQRWHSFDVIARVLAERLQGCEASAELRAMMRSPGIDWERVVGFAGAQFVLPAFAASLRDLELLVWLDEELGAFLEAVHAANVERNSELKDELAAAVGVLNRADIEPTLLKGAIRLLDGVYPDPGWRMLRDLDLLIPEPRWQDALDALQRAGYALTCAADSAAVLRPPGGLVAIDVHKELFPTSRQKRLLHGGEVVHGARPALIGRAAVRLPSMLHQVVHLVGHSQIRNYNHAFGRISLRDRLETAALVHWAAEPVDWDAVLARFAAAGYRRPLLSFLLALRDGAPIAVPASGKVDMLTALQERRIAWQTRSRVLAHISFWPMWCVAMLRMQIEEREGGRPKFVKTLARLTSEGGAGQRMLRTFIYGAPRPD
jgi:Uncharacterised nucleotidyltransferase